jgi:DNA-binding transcriptional LysR family regulator
VVPVYYDLVLQVCREAEFVPHAPHELDDPQLVLGFVAAGMGVSLVPASVRWTMPRGIVFVPLVPPARVLQTAIAWRKDNTAPLVGDFLDVVRRTVRVSRSQAEPIRSGD